MYRTFYEFYDDIMKKTTFETYKIGKFAPTHGTLFLQRVGLLESVRLEYSFLIANITYIVLEKI